MYHFRFPSPKYKYFCTENVTMPKRLLLTLQKKLGLKKVLVRKFIQILRKFFNPEQFEKNLFVPRSGVVARENFSKNFDCQIMIPQILLRVLTKP